MIPVDFIEKKKNGLEHSKEEIHEFITKYVEEKIPDYQMAAWLMAVNFQGMTDNETMALVETMLNSGETMDLSGIDKFKVDKHSTGGVGDKVSLILAPLANAAGCIVPMISGRGLGHSGGTLDKLESIPGFNVKLTKNEFVNLVTKYGMAMGGQTKKIVPADRKMYALRDVTGTVKSIPLICGSILSKKIAEGIDGLILDVKTGNGAFLKEYNNSQKLAKQLKTVGEHFGLKVKAVITDMNQPLGKSVGNWLEVVECIDVLKGKGPDDLKEITLHLTAWMVTLSGAKKNFEESLELLRKKLDSGEAYEKFLEMVRIQGGDLKVIENPTKYKKAAVIKPVKLKQTGFLKTIDNTAIGMISLGLGAGRQTINDIIIPEVGLVMNKRIGDSVKNGDILCEIHAQSESDFVIAEKAILKAITISENKVSPPPLFYETF